MSTKTINSRIIHKHAVEADWLKATNFTPLKGELIVYDIDNNYNYERLKVGDGKTLVTALPFVDAALRTSLLAQINAVDDKVDAVSALVGDESVSDQIAEGIAGKADKEHTHDVVYLDENSGLSSEVSWTDIAYGNGKFVAIAVGTNQAAYSTDGVKWTMTTMPSKQLWSSVAFGDGYFVAVASGYNKYARSSNGKTWSTYSMPSSAEWRAIEYGAGIFVAVASGDDAAYGTVGSTFTSSTLPANAEWCGVSYNGYYFIAVADDNNTIGLSYDGSYWSTSYGTSMYPGLLAVASSPMYESVALGTQLSGTFQYTTDCYNWYEVSVPYGEWVDVAYGDGKFVTVEQGSNRAMYSDNGGSTWVNTTLPSDEAWECVVYGFNKFVAIASNSDAVAYSYDGVTWFGKKPTLFDNEGNDVTLEIGAQFSNWEKIYDSGYTTDKVNAFSGINVADYKNIMVAIRNVNTSSSAGGISGAVIFKGANGKDYPFKNIFSNLITNTVSVSGALAIFKVMNGFIVCENAMRAVSAENMLSGVECMGADNLLPLGGGIVQCNSPVSTMMIANASLSSSYYYGSGSRVIVWGCRL